MVALNKEMQENISAFQRLLIRHFGLEKLTKKLQNWYLLEFNGFTRELKKLKIKLSKKEKIKWKYVFLSERERVRKIKKVNF